MDSLAEAETDPLQTAAVSREQTNKAQKRFCLVRCTKQNLLIERKTLN